MPKTVTVALRKESVDRNLVGGVNRTINIVALRKESVDRNVILPKQLNRPAPSLSARRAWIEMCYSLRHPASGRCRSPQGERG